MASINYKTGSVNAYGYGMSKDQRSNIELPWGVSKTPMMKNIYGDKEFIVKLQSPLGGLGLPWMCYDGPTRSFQASFQLILVRDNRKYTAAVKGGGSSWSLCT
jgi:hypothetical protein